LSEGKQGNVKRGPWQWQEESDCRSFNYNWGLQTKDPSSKLNSWKADRRIRWEPMLCEQVDRSLWKSCKVIFYFFKYCQIKRVM
jgi:hypothetical protein